MEYITRQIHCHSMHMYFCVSHNPEISREGGGGGKDELCRIFQAEVYDKI
jgi:hypothetical protein